MLRVCQLLVSTAQSFIIITSASDLPLRTIKCCSELLTTSVNNLPRFVAAKYIALGDRTVHSTRWSHILAENRLPHLHLMPPLGGSPSKYCHDV